MDELNFIPIGVLSIFSHVVASAKDLSVVLGQDAAPHHYQIKYVDIKYSDIHI